MIDESSLNMSALSDTIRFGRLSGVCLRWTEFQRGSKTERSARESLSVHCSLRPFQLLV